MQAEGDISHTEMVKYREQTHAFCSNGIAAYKCSSSHQAFTVSQELKLVLDITAQGMILVQAVEFSTL